MPSVHKKPNRIALRRMGGRYNPLRHTAIILGYRARQTHTTLTGPNLLLEQSKFRPPRSWWGQPEKANEKPDKAPVLPPKPSTAPAPARGKGLKAAIMAAVSYKMSSRNPQTKIKRMLDDNGDEYEMADGLDLPVRPTTVFPTSALGPDYKPKEYGL